MTAEPGLEYALHRVHEGELDLVEHLLAMRDRHRTDHEVFHVTWDLVRWSRDNLAQLAELGKQHDVELDPEVGRPGVLSRMTEAASSLVGRRSETGLLLLEDLRGLYLRASANSLAWEMLAQHAQAKREQDALDVATRCHAQTLRQIRWANTMLKTQSPQVLASL
jgi:hypothetical protein